MVHFDEAKVLNTFPFQDDFGCPGDKTLRDKIVTARKGGECHDCGQQIRPGERIRTLTERFDGELGTYRWCSECCAAMARSEVDGGDAWTARLNLRDQQRANAK